jgi:hypothetical protein
MLNNAGHIWIWNDYSDSWADTSHNLPICSYGSCSYTVRFSGSAEWYSDLTNFPVYSGCVAPTIETTQSEVLTDRYSFGFNITNNGGYSGINCSFSLDGLVDNYGKYFQTTTSFDVTFTEFPLQYATARLICVYKDGSNNTLTFKDSEWLVYNGERYLLYDMNSVRGKVTTTPRHLYPKSILTHFEFQMLSDTDFSAFGKPIYAFLTTTDDLASKGCTEGFNTTQKLYPPYDMLVYEMCNNTANISANLIIKDMQGNQLDNVTFNISFEAGNMVIDNINFIIDYYTNAINLWATVSNDYDKSPIPSNANLSCVYSAVAGNGSVYTGSMVLLETTSNGEVIQTDVYDTTVTENPTPYVLGDLFMITINCSASNYTTKSKTTMRWLGAKRLKTFKCVVGNGFINNYMSQNGEAYTIYYTNPYLTYPVNISCVVIPDNYNFGMNDFASQSHIYLNRNYNSLSILSNCKDAIGGITSIVGEGLSIYYKYSTNTLVNKDASCLIHKLQEGKISNDIIEFNFDPSITYGQVVGYTTCASIFPIFLCNALFNTTSTRSTLITPTTADITFDLEYNSPAVVYPPSFSIQTTKTANQNIVETNNTVICQNAVEDNSSTVYDMDQIIYDVATGSQCTTQHPARDQTGNNYTYSTVLVVNQNTCPFFKEENLHGDMKCKSTAYIRNINNPQVDYSDALPYITPYSNNTANNNKMDAVLGNLFDVIVTPIFSWFKANLLFAMFLLFIFIVIAIPIAYLAVMIYTRRREG